MADQTGRDLRTKAHYAGVSAPLPQSLADIELADDRILSAATPIIPQADAQFCREVRLIAGFLYHGIKNPPPAEKQLKKEIEQVRALVVNLQKRLMRLTAHTSGNLSELIDLTAPEPVEQLTKMPDGGAFPPAPEGAFTPVAATEEDGVKEISEPEWALVDPVGDFLLVLQEFQERLDVRLAEQKSGGRPRSAKWFALLLLRDLAHEHKGSCSESDLSALAQAYLGPVLALHEDYADLSEHIRNVVNGSSRRRRCAARLGRLLAGW